MAWAFSSVPPAPKVGSNPGRTEHRATDPGVISIAFGAALDHAPRVDTVHHGYGEPSGAAGGGAGEGTLVLGPNAGSVDTAFQIVKGLGSSRSGC
jgi:hypothetical protein